MNIKYYIKIYSYDKYRSHFGSSVRSHFGSSIRSHLCEIFMDSKKYTINLCNLFINVKNKLHNNSIIVDFNKIPIITVKYDLTIEINYIYEKYIFTNFFVNHKNKKYSYFIYCLIINLYTNTNYKIYGDLIFALFNNDNIENIDLFYDHFYDIYKIDEIINKKILINLVNKYNLFSYKDNNKYNYIFSQDEYNNNIILIIYILLKLIYNDKNIKCDIYCINKKYNYKIKFNNFTINLKKNDNKFNFLEHMLYINKINNILVFNIFKTFNFNIKLILSKILPSFKKSDLIFNLISKFIGIDYMCILECIYYIVNHKLRLCHDNCVNISSVKYINNEDYKKIFKCNKILNHEISKFKNKKYKIFFSNICKKNNCICYINELYKLYKLKNTHYANDKLLEKNIPIQFYYEHPKFNIFVETYFGYTYLEYSNNTTNINYDYIEMQINHNTDMYIDDECHNNNYENYFKNTKMQIIDEWNDYDYDYYKKYFKNTNIYISDNWIDDNENYKYNKYLNKKLKKHKYLKNYNDYY